MKKNTSAVLNKLQVVKKNLRLSLGKQFMKEVDQEKQRYDELHSQAQFLYLELLMSEKEQLLGRELHAENKVTEVSTHDDIRGWGKNTQGWMSERKGEYWWDEIGFHIVDVESKCLANHE